MDKDLIAISRRVWNLQETITMSFYAVSANLWLDTFMPLKEHSPIAQSTLSLSPWKRLHIICTIIQNLHLIRPLHTVGECWKIRENKLVFRMSLTVMRCAHKGKAVPLQAWSGPNGNRKLRFPDFMTTAQDGGKVVSFTHPPPLPPGNTPGTHFC
jgi:hypothetical protein